MKLCSFALAGLICVMATPVLTQTSPSVAALERQDFVERVIRLSADVETLLADNAALRKRLAAIETELNTLREAQFKAARQNNAQEELSRLAEQVREVDRKRLDDRKLILSEIEKLGKTIASPKPRDNPAPPGPQKAIEYTIEANDTVSSVLAEVNRQFKEKNMKPVTLKQVQAANPGVNLDRIMVGQKIFIPIP
jgi:small-conductance mechanosensitive channel